MRVCGIDFFSGDDSESLERMKSGGLLLAPSGPGLTSDLLKKPVYREAVVGADLNLADSGAMVLAWNLIHAFSFDKKIRRVSGLKFLRSLVTFPEFQKPEATFWVMPSKDEADRNFDWLRGHGFPYLGEGHCYLAPAYQAHGTGRVEDSGLLALCEAKKPRFVVLNIGGGTQEPLGWWLRQNLSYRPAIICTGAAIAFITGGQADIPPWADRFYLGWLLRIVDAPSKFMRRYWEARSIFWLVWKYRDQMPPLKPDKKLEKLRT